MRAWVYSASMNTSELQAVMTISPPRFSRTVLFNVLLLSRGEWLRGKIGVGGVINLKKKLSFAKISASSGASQAGLWMKTSQFDIFSFYQTCFPCPCIVTLCQTLWVELARHTVPRVCRDAEPILSLHLPTTTSADFSEMGSVNLMEKGAWQILYMCCIESCYNQFTPLIISVTCLRFLAPEVNASWTQTGAEAATVIFCLWMLGSW